MLLFIIKAFIFSTSMKLKIKIYKGKMRSSRPSLRENRDKQQLGKELDRSWCHHTKSMTGAGVTTPRE